MAVSGYIGIDINKSYTMVSFLNTAGKEPVTVSTIAGEEKFQIPLCVVKRQGMGQWLYGEEAVMYERKTGIQGEYDLFERASHKERVEIEGESYTLFDLSFLYLKKIMALPAKLGNAAGYEKIVVSMEHISEEMLQLFWIFMEKLEVPLNQFQMLDYKESFYYYVLNQRPELYRDTVILMDFAEKELNVAQLTVNTKNNPQIVTITEKALPYRGEEKDAYLGRMVQSICQGKRISTIYLVGDGFDGDWMKDSLKILCGGGRRAFLGKNLFSKGACYGASKNPQNWKYVYLGENEIKKNVSIKVEEHGSESFFTLISAGENWFEAGKECELVIRGDVEIDIWIHDPGTKEAVVRQLFLQELQYRPEGTTRIRLKINPISAKQIEIELLDLGFGEIVPASERKYRFEISLDEAKQEGEV